MTDLTDTEPTYSDADTWRRLSRVWQLTTATLRAAPVAVLFGGSWVCSAAVALVWYGLIAGWRDMRAFTNTES